MEIRMFGCLSTTKFGLKIHNRRLELGYESVYKLADALDISHFTVREWERGRSLPIANAFIKLCKVLEVGVDYFDDCWENL